MTGFRQFRIEIVCWTVISDATEVKRQSDVVWLLDVTKREWIFLVRLRAKSPTSVNGLVICKIAAGGQVKGRAEAKRGEQDLRSDIRPRHPGPSSQGG